MTRSRELISSLYRAYVYGIENAQDVQDRLSAHSTAGYILVLASRVLAKTVEVEFYYHFRPYYWKIIHFAVFIVSLSPMLIEPVIFFTYNFISSVFYFIWLCYGPVTSMANSVASLLTPVSSKDLGEQRWKSCRMVVVALVVILLTILVKWLQWLWEKLKPRNRIITNSDLGIDSQLPDQYFVYCKTCEDITPGELRVCCSRCSEDAMSLYQDPSSWDDVLKSERIRGWCPTPGCEGDIAMFSFKCAKHPAAEGDRCVALRLIRSNTRDIPCLTCSEVEDPVLVFPCADGHVVCLDCFKNYCKTKLNDRQFVLNDDHGYTLPCPGDSDSCTNAFPDAHHFLVLEQDQYERYLTFATEGWLLKMGGVLCPGRGCGMGLLPEDNMRSVTCSSCNLEFCKECKEPYQRGHSCRQNQNQSSSAAVARPSRYQEDAENARRARWDAEAKQVIERISNKCPGCQTNTEKNAGCNHMTCTRCKFEWCWICVKRWSDCRSSH